MRPVLTSSGVRVFPASLRIYNGMGKYTTENNLTGIPRSVTDYNSFLISRKKSDKPFKFVIHGYYFEMDDMGFSATPLDDANLYIHILVENTGEYSRLVKYARFNGGTDIDTEDIDLNSEIDESGNFNAIAIDNTADPVISSEKPYTVYTLRLTDKNGELYPPSFRKIASDSIGSADGEDIGRFERTSDGSMGFSQPIWFKQETGWETINTTFWGDYPPSPERPFINKDNISVSKVAEAGDIFFKITME